MNIEDVISGGRGEFAAISWRGNGIAIGVEAAGAAIVYRAELPSKTLFFTHICDAPDVRKLSIWPEYLRSFISFPRLVSTHTAIQHVEQIAPGAVHFETKLGVFTREIACNLSNIPQASAVSVEQAGEVLQTAMNSVSILADAEVGTSLIELSGGLDSSITGEWLRQHKKIMAVHYRIGTDHRYNEQQYAELFANANGIELAEFDIGDFAPRIEDFETSPLTPRPSMAAFTTRQSRMTEKLAARHEITEIWTGSGGDAVFYNYPAAFSGSDILRAQGLKGLREAVGRIHSTTSTHFQFIDHVLMAIIKPYFNIHRHSGIAAVNDDVLKAFGIEGDFRFLEHNWLTGIQNLPPGKALQMYYIVDAIKTVERGIFFPGRRLVNFPLQRPILEACIQIPSFILSEQGRDRELVRNLFKDRLPESIIRRYQKTSGSIPVVSAFVRNNYKEAIEYLGDGELRRAGVIGLKFIESIMEMKFLSSHIVCASFIRAIIAESWVRGYYDK